MNTINNLREKIIKPQIQTLFFFNYYLSTAIRSEFRSGMMLFLLLDLFRILQVFLNILYFRIYVHVSVKTLTILYACKSGLFTCWRKYTYIHIYV